MTELLAKKYEVHESEMMLLIRSTERYALLKTYLLCLPSSRSEIVISLKSKRILQRYEIYDKRYDVRLVTIIIHYSL